MKGPGLLIATLTLALAAFGQGSGPKSGGAPGGGATPGMQGTTGGAAGTAAVPGVQGTTGGATGPAAAPSNTTAGTQPAAPGMSGTAATPGVQGSTSNDTGTPSAPGINTPGVQPIAPGTAGTTNTGTVPNSTGVVTNGGYVYNGAPASPPLLVAPIVHLGATTPGVGATDATPGNAVGATSYNGPATTPPPPETLVPEVSLPAGSALAPQPPIAIGPAVLDRGISSMNSAYDAQASQSLPEGESLAQYAARFRTQRQSQSAHVYTNTDVDRLNQQTGGLSGSAVSAGNPAGAPPPRTSPMQPAVSQPAGQAQPGIAMPTAPATPPQPQQTPIPHAQAGMGSNSGQQPTEMAQATPPAAPGTAAQGGAASSNASAGAADQNNQQNDGRTLPRSASPLPLMAVLGFFAAGAGMFLRR